MIITSKYSIYSSNKNTNQITARRKSYVEALKHTHARRKFLSKHNMPCGAVVFFNDLLFTYLHMLKHLNFFIIIIGKSQSNVSQKKTTKYVVRER